ncbi:hypothetical protein FHX82_001637 [Amycolatopsis bartoniae]|uniref:DUF6542 domain-containing protein n=1 Tax=Amycolatopsis bartoniae TaxID=941986 RepID=A0A8H9IXE5_9PSEU|nr:DUF6542 domain-containing protein [Amycolatopsis bartoniae]MBB2934617.1 hypothetical protein [Amycolatopsis bartoniae]TVT09282.1 hypothetical protein FNH07_08935 [Amycolatopsis bartoniae]GHF46057.1 hypothetical protein GCM10017566_18920 [Amycolatopsis bartoniae]
MTAIRDRQSDTDADEVAVPWDARPVVGERRGLPWWGAVLLAFGFAVVGAVAGLQLQNGLSLLFDICYFIGAVAAVCAVQRRSLFGPMVQPPLILAITVPLVVLLVSGLPANSDTLAKALAIGTPLINGFPAMAITTGFTLAIGMVRLYRERNPEAVPKSGEGKPSPARKRPSSQARTRDGEDDRAGKPARGVAERKGRDGGAERGGGATRVRRPTEGRSPAQRPLAGEQHPSLPLTPRRRSEDPPRRAEPGRDSRGDRGDRRERGGESGRGKTPPPSGRRVPRGGAPDEGESRRGGEGRRQPGDRPRRLPPRGGTGESRGASGEPPRRSPGRRGGPPPRGRRPWEDDA